MVTILDGIAGVKAYAGKHLGKSDWLRIEQDRIDKFADATGDKHWIHTDPQRAKDSPFGKTIAHGYLTLSVIFELLATVYKLQNLPMGLNYGINKLRFVSAVPVDSRIRLDVTMKEALDVKNGVQFTLDCTFELEDSDRPACVAEVVFRFYESAAVG
jgi:acyl dehydratase